MSDIIYNIASCSGDNALIIPYESQSPQYRLISEVKRLVEKFLASQKARDVLLTIADTCENIVWESINANQINTSTVQPGYTSTKNLDRVQAFLDAMVYDATFPLIIADKRITDTFGLMLNDRAILGGEVHFRRVHILINYHRVEEMVEASLTQNPDLMAYQFQLACTILRLIGQIFCVFLKNHMNVLPPIKSMIDNTTIDLNLKLDPVTEKIGVIFESMMFGSQIDWLRDPTRADNCNQSGQPYFANKDSSTGGACTSWSPVDMGYIKRLLVDHKYDRMYPVAITCGKDIHPGDNRRPVFHSDWYNTQVATRNG